MQRCVAIILSVVVLSVSACSGSDTVEVTTSVEAGPVEGAATAEAGSVESVEEGSVSTADFCDAIAAIESAEFELEETFGPEARQLFDDVQSASPPEIADDVATVIDTLEALAEVGISTEDDDPEALDAAFEILLDPHFTEASENLEVYTSAACGIDLGDDDDTDLDLDDLAGFDEVELVEPATSNPG